MARERVAALLGLLLLLGVLQPATVSAGSPLRLGDERGEYPLGLEMEILEDVEGSLTIDDVSSPPLSESFVPSRHNT